MRTALATLVFVIGVAHAGSPPPAHTAQEAGLAKAAAKIKTYCENASLVIRVDWRAFEALDLQAITGGNDGTNLAANPDYVERARRWVLYADDMGRGSPFLGSATAGGGTALAALEIICRDHPELRAAAAKLTTIVLEPTNDMTFLADHDKIAFARRTKDWSAVQKAFSDEKRDDAEGFRVYRPRFAISGTTLTVTQNILARSGDDNDFAQALMKVMRGEKDDPKQPPPGTQNTKPKPMGKGVNCDRQYTDVSDYSPDKAYSTDELAKYTWGGIGTHIYRCTNKDGCSEKEASPHDSSWKAIAHCE